MSAKAKFVTYIEANDPDTGAIVQMGLYKHEGGGLIAIDESYLEQVATEHETEDCYVIPDPLSDVDELSLLFLYD